MLFDVFREKQGKGSMALDQGCQLQYSEGFIHFTVRTVALYIISKKTFGALCGEQI